GAAFWNHCASNHYCSVPGHLGRRARLARHLGSSRWCCHWRRLRAHYCGISAGDVEVFSIDHDGSGAWWLAAQGCALDYRAYDHQGHGILCHDDHVDHHRCRHDYSPEQRGEGHYHITGDLYFLSPSSPEEKTREHATAWCAPCSDLASLGSCPSG